ncbi:MAG: enoyl-CoA hydratase/isomerase family protein [Planctomycetes bacterium]|nr:enoyl-CoA hydratase/isomerase family protein [Planctomycetota bacterium]MBI3844860.1 enoyl-CoA hydratase/isomerase family protein [Planctomycetota bacterium]
METLITIDVAPPVGRVVLNRPDLHNAFNDVVLHEITEAFAKLGHQPDVRVVVLAAEGKSFCAGADLNWMKKMVGYSFDENVKDAQGLVKMLRTIHDCPKPVIARVQGPAFGGGVGLVAAADMAIAVESATFSLSEARLGLLPAAISPFVLEKIGPAAARRYFLTAERFSAVEAKRLGLVSEVAATAEDADLWIDGIVDAVRACGPEAVAACKALIRDVWGQTLDHVAGLTARWIAERRASAEGQEGMKAFLEKRPPSWSPGPK